MPLVTLAVSLVGGPPWGFRVAQQHGEPPIVSQVLPDGRAYNEGIRAGDFIEGVNGEDCAFASEVHDKMRNAKGVLRLRLKRLSGRAQRLPPLPQLQLDPENASTPDSSAPPTPSSEISLNRAAKPPLHSYNGGMRGSAQEKKKFFELAIARQTQASPSPIRQEHRDRPKYQSNSAISESGTDISGYDSVAGDYYDRYTPTSSQDEYFYNNDNHSQTDGAKTPIAFNHNQNDFGQALRASSTTPLAIRLTEDRQPPLPWENQPNNADCSSVLMSDENGYGYPSIGQNMHDTSADSGVASLVGVPPPPPPPPGAVRTDLDTGGKKWSIRVDENSSSKPAPVITSSVKTGKASGEVEVPRPQSVAELRAQIATKLEVRNPAGESVSPISAAQAPQASVVHQPPQPQHGRMTPSCSLLSLDRIQRGLDSYDLQEYPSTSLRNQFANEYSPTPSLPPFYGRDEPSKYSPNSATTEFPGGDYYPTSSLKRQHSQLQLQPEVQHAVLLHPGYGNSNRSMQASVSMLDLSTPVEYAPPPASYHNPAYSVLKNDSHLTSPAIAEPSSPLGNNHLLQNSFNEQHDNTSRTFSPSYNGYNGVAENTPTLAEHDSAQVGVVSRDAPLSASISSSFSQEPAANFDHDAAFQSSFEPPIERKGTATPSIGTNPAPKTFNKPSWDQEERPLDNTSDRALASESQADPPKSNRLAELIQLANESYGDDTGCSQLIDTLWTKTLNSVNNSAPPAGALRRPRSALDLTNGTVMNGYSTLPARGSRGTSVRPRNPADEEKSQWYRQISKEIHHAPPSASERIITSVPHGDPLEQSMSNLRSTTPQTRFDQQSTDFNPQQRRARSVGRYDAVADMEILDKFSQQRQQISRELNDETPKESPRTGMEALQIACTSSSRNTQACPHQSSVSDDISDTARSANAYAISRSKTQHFHLPSYRFVHEDARPIPSPRNCYRCGKNRRDYTWNEIEHLYLMLDKDTLKKEALRESLGEKVKLRHIENRLQDTAQDLQKVIEQLEAYGKTRSKSNPEIAYKLRNCNGKFNYLVGPRRSGVNGQTRVNDDVKKATMEEVLQRQRAEKLSEELDDQRSRRHGYFPGAAPALQNNVQRLDHLLQNTQVTTNGFDYTSSRCSTPARRANSQGPVQTCTVLYKFTAQSSRELSLNRGDVVRVHREIDNNWIEGERNGQIGIFPVSYVQMDEDPSTSRNRVRALYPFQARNRNELSLKKDEILRRRRDIDANWIEGTNSKGQIGIFPRCYVRDHTDVFENGIDDVQSVIPDRPKTPKIVTTSYSSRAVSPSPSKKSLDRTQQVQQWEQRRDNFGYSGPARMVPKNSETYRALYSYKPEHSDELELQENDIIFVVEKCDDGWFIGTLLRTGQFGTFPGNYVEKH